MKIITVRLTVIALLLFSSSLFAQDYVIDPVKNCIFLNGTEEVKDIPLKVKLDLSTRYEISLSGRAYLSDQRGAEADPFPGVILFYCTNGQDGYATQYTLLEPGKKVEFTTPAIDPDSVFLMAFLLDYWPGSTNTGQFKLGIIKK